MTEWQQRHTEVARRIDGRQLIWFGTRGTDTEPLRNIGEISAVFSQIAPPEFNTRSECLEDYTLRRVDLNRYNIDTDLSLEATRFKDRLWEATGSQRSLLIPYRPLASLAGAYFTASDTVQYCGMFHLQQATFEHKPWMEQQLGPDHIRTVPWRYLRQGDDAGIRRELAKGPVVLRANISDGGAGLVLVEHADALTDLPPWSDGFGAIAPYFRGAVPFNLNACIYATGDVMVFPLSYQLIGLDVATRRTFGFCGNDFGAARALPRMIVERAEGLAVAVGHRLHRNGYLGQFGIDLLWHEGELYVTEVNPRFQGSTPLCAALMRDMGLPDPFLEHLAAHLQLAAPPRMQRLADVVGHTPDGAQVILYNRRAEPLYLGAQPIDLPPGCRVAGRARPEVAVEPEGLLLKLRFDRVVTSDGYSLLPEVQDQVAFALTTIGRGARVCA
jgi:hypothetical protein